MKPNIRLVLVVLLPWLVYGIPTSAQVALAPNFSYSGDAGPAFWVEMSPTCGTTPFARQSPVDIRRVVEHRTLGPLDVILYETSFTIRSGLRRRLRVS